MPKHQLSLTLIPHKVAESIVDQRAADGYINATAMCQAAGKLMADYNRLNSTKDFLGELAGDMGIPISQLIQVLRPGGAGLQGTWVHPQVAIHLAQWVSPKFAVQVSKWVFDWMSGKGQPTKLPFHLERHMINLHKIPRGYFSALQEMTNFMVGPMEVNGYRLREDLMPDISQAKMLCKYLREIMDIDTKTLPKYTHTFPDGREVEANLYPDAYLATFRRLMSEKWMPEQAPIYFKKRDPAALAALDKVLMVAANRPQARLPGRPSAPH
jgi:hypothetical protein